jgi:hypothetical protein
MKDILDNIAGAIEEIERKWRAVLREPPADAMLPVRWSYTGDELRWHVLIGDDVLESDVDIEITSTVIIVRARSAREETKVLLGLLPVPGSFEVCDPEIYIRSHAIEIVVYPTRGDDR